MANYTTIANNFISGELSPMMAGRIDSPRYKTGLDTLSNFIPLSSGPAIKRPGTKYIGQTQQGDGIKLALLDAGPVGRFVVEFTDLQIRFWSENGTLVESGGSPVTKVTTYVEADIPELSCVTNNGTMYVVHANYPPMKITVASGPSFTYSSITFTGDRTFSSTGDYPSCQAFKGGRWYLAATDNEPNAIFASRTPDITTGSDRFTDFTFSDPSTGDVLSTHAIYLQEADMYGSRINWLINQNRILAGAGSSIWMDSGDIATPATFDMSVTLSSGSSAIPAKGIDNYIIYVGSGGKTLNIMHYNSESDGYLSEDLSSHSSHLFKSGIKDFSVSRSEDTIIWVIDNNGKLYSCTLNTNLGAVGWAKHPRSVSYHNFLAVEVIPSNGSNNDIVWFAVNTGSYIFIETIELNVNEPENSVYIDCWSERTYETPTDTLESIDEAFHEQYVSAYADNSMLPTKYNESTSIVYDREFSSIIYGFLITSSFKTLRPELPANGTNQGKRLKVMKVYLRMYKSLGGSVGLDTDSLKDIVPIVSGTYEYGSAHELFTGDLEIQMNSFSTKDGRILVVSDTPYPFNLLAVMTTFGIMEG